MLLQVFAVFEKQILHEFVAAKFGHVIFVELLDLAKVVQDRRRRVMKILYI